MSSDFSKYIPSIEAKRTKTYKWMLLTWEWFSADSLATWEDWSRLKPWVAWRQQMLVLILNVNENFREKLQKLKKNSQPRLSMYGWSLAVSWNNHLFLKICSSSLSADTLYRHTISERLQQTHLRRSSILSGRRQKNRWQVAVLAYYTCNSEPNMVKS